MQVASAICNLQGATTRCSDGSSSRTKAQHGSRFVQSVLESRIMPSCEMHAKYEFRCRLGQVGQVQMPQVQQMPRWNCGMTVCAVQDGRHAFRVCISLRFGQDVRQFQEQVQVPEATVPIGQKPQVGLQFSCHGSCYLISVQGTDGPNAVCEQCLFRATGLQNWENQQVCHVKTAPPG